MVEVMKIMATSFRRCPQPAAGARRPTPPPETWTLPGKSGSVSCGVTAPFSWVLVCRRFRLCLSRVCFPSPVEVLAVLWWVKGDLLQEGLCHTHICCTQSPRPCSRPLLTRASTGDAQTQFWLCLCGVSGSW